jgi:lipopolysaccharide biosynthesis glycosyltransferase
MQRQEYFIPLQLLIKSSVKNIRKESAEMNEQKIPYKIYLKRADAKSCTISELNEKQARPLLNPAHLN